MISWLSNPNQWHSSHQKDKRGKVKIDILTLVQLVTMVVSSMLDGTAANQGGDKHTGNVV
jgi:hypothetical protein